MKKRLQTILAHAGVASRRYAGELIVEGKVSVDGRIITEKGFRADPGECKIEVSGRPIPKEEKKYYFLFNKPKDVVSTASDTHGRKKVIDFFKEIDARLYPVGRLDKDTTGLLIITNDGNLSHRLSHPSFGVEKEYRAHVTPAVSDRQIKKLEKGVKIKDKVTSPCRIRIEESSGSGGVYNIKLHEGRKRQIRLMFRGIGAKVTELERIKYAGLSLEGLEQGKFRALTERELAKLRRLRD